MVTRQAYHRVFLATMDRFESLFKGKIVADKDKFITACASEYRTHGVPNFFHLVDKHQGELFDSLKAHYRMVIPAFGALSLSQVKSRQFKATAEDALFEDLANRWVHTEGLKRSKLIADTSEADVLAAISSGIEDGLGTAEIADDIQKVTGLSDWRAESIARTETHAAANYASVESVRQAEDRLGVRMLKEWLPTLDGRTRPAHAEMEGSDPIPMEDKFLVDGEEMDRPGDPAGSAENVISCRCVLGFSEEKE
ncbi:phage minor head protein [Zavarzinella formosa]|uniref:phage minor head protein n=1 Tax=Zavarzinella formosa TaxID=360055 RepID=UPI0003195EE0|nr:phage minor head protein [Zavarzinella formosa]